MKTTRNLRLHLRLIEGALVLLLGALTTGAVATHQLLLDATNRPTDDVNISGPHWVGTLDGARLPASVPTLAGDNTLAASGYRAGGPGTAFPFTMVGNDAAGIPGCGLYTEGSVVFNGSNLFCNGSISVDQGFITTDGMGDINFNTATLPLLDPSAINAPPAGVTLYASDLDGHLHYLDAAGNDHTLTNNP